MLARSRGFLGRILPGGIEALAGLATLVLVLLPLLDLLLARIFYRGIGPAGALIDHSLVVLAFMAAATASRHGNHLSLSGSVGNEGEDPAGAEARKAAAAARPWPRKVLAFATSALSRGTEAWITTMYFWASLSLVFVGFDAGARVWIIPTRVFAAAIPLGFLVMAIQSLRRPGRTERLAAIIGVLAGSILGASAIANLTGAILPGTAPLLGRLPELSLAFLSGGRPLLTVLLVAAGLAGAPLFAVLGGIAFTFLGGTGRFLEIAPSEAYALLRGSSVASLPLFAIAGFILAESGAGRRLVAVFRELFGFLPGGEAIAAVLVCAFFTTFTGANGVTIIALGGLLAGILVESGCASPGFARGLITASGAIGLLLPPSAAVIIYGINAQYIYGEGALVDITELFKGALVPGLLLVFAMGAAGVFEARKRKVAPKRFAPSSALGALRPAWPELITPAIALGLYFTGTAGLTEIAAFTVIYLIVVETLVTRDLDLKGVYRAFRKSLPIVGGTLAILAAARGLSFYLIDADVPNLFTNWVKSTATSPFLFLLFLNLALLVVGSMMDIFSAILVAAPLVIPLGAAFGLNPIHLGVVFILNLCIGFLTPPVGMSLFLAGYAFKQPLARIIKETFPFLIVQVAVLILVTYVPGLTTFLLKK